MWIPWLFVLALLPISTPAVLVPAGVVVEARLGDEVTEQQQSAATKAFEELQARMEEAWEGYLAPLQEAKTSEERDAIELDPAKSPAVIFLSPMLEFTKEHPGTDACLQALSEVIRMSSSDENTKNAWMLDVAVDAVLSDFLSHDGLHDLVRFGYYNPPSAAIFRLLRGVSDRSAVRDVKAASLYSLGKLLGKKKDTRSEGRQVLERVAKDFSDVVFVGESTYGKKVKGDIFELEHLQIGNVAPEIIGKSIDGNLMQLSAFRGKVVLLDFWGDW
jgi:hypothetical protein